MGLSGKLTNGTSVFAVDVFGNLNILISQQKVLSVSLLMEYITRRRQGNMNINEPISNPKLVSAIEGLSNNNATQQKFLKNQHKLNLNCPLCQGHFELVQCLFLDIYTKVISLILDIPWFGSPQKWTHDIFGIHGNGHTIPSSVIFSWFIYYHLYQLPMHQALQDPFYGWHGRNIRNIQRIFTRSNKFVEFIRRQPGKMPLIPPVVVIINVVINDDLNISK